MEVPTFQQLIDLRNSAFSNHNIELLQKIDEALLKYFPHFEKDTVAEGMSYEIAAPTTTYCAEAELQQIRDAGRMISEFYDSSRRMKIYLIKREPAQWPLYCWPSYDADYEVRIIPC